MERVHLATLIANLEGVLKQPFGEHPYDLSISALENRVASLELASRIAAPPPLAESTWNGLVWRVLRIDTANFQMPTRDHADKIDQAAAMVSVDEGDVTIESLSRIVDSIGPAAGRFGRASEGIHAEKNLSDNELLVVVTQKLCYLCGSYRTPCQLGLLSPVRLYVAAAMLAHSSAVSMRQWPSPPFGPAMNSFSPPHTSRRPKFPTRGKNHWKNETRRWEEAKRKQRGEGRGWLSKLMFWRWKSKPKENTYSIYTTSSGSSREILD